MGSLQLVLVAAVIALWASYRLPVRLPAAFYNPALPALVAAVFAAFALLRGARFALRSLPTARGFEADWIARAIVDGHGFSFPGNHRWLTETAIGNPAEFFPTAWADPVYTFLLAGAHVLFGEQVYAAAFAFGFILLGCVFYGVYRIGGRFRGPWTGTTAVVLLGIHASFHWVFFQVNSAGLAAAIITATMLAGIRYFERATGGRLVVLALAAGLTALTNPASVYFVYALAAAVAFHHRAVLRLAGLRGLAVLGLAAVVIAPWTLRNYATFGEYILVRNGAGELAYAATVGVGATFLPEVEQASAPARWASTTPMQAVQELLDDRDKRAALYEFEVEALMTSPDIDFATASEGQKDRFLFDRAKQFVLEHPGIALQMGIAKLGGYAMLFGIYGLALLALAVVTALSTIRDARTWPLTLTLATYVPLFALIAPYFTRYRTPTEPVVAALAAIGLAAAHAWFANELSRRTSHRSRLPEIANP